MLGSIDSETTYSVLIPTMFSETTGTQTVVIMTNRTSDVMKKRFLIARARLNEGVVLDDMTNVLSVLLNLFS